MIGASSEYLSYSFSLFYLRMSIQLSIVQPWIMLYTNSLNPSQGNTVFLTRVYNSFGITLRYCPNSSNGVLCTGLSPNFSCFLTPIIFLLLLKRIGMVDHSM